ncbi:Sterol regulatory element-binding protein 1 [Fusarium oxysporum f. sp. albedinis]|nr:Sterol regulatory element-binding protein 1 [Fusarium oxysporum f. sp. albedinis]
MDAFSFPLFYTRRWHPRPTTFGNYCQLIYTPQLSRMDEHLVFHCPERSTNHPSSKSVLASPKNLHDVYRV